jgi:broad specificity phosphatase PhoE
VTTDNEVQALARELAGGTLPPELETKPEAKPEGEQKPTGEVTPKGDGATPPPDALADLAKDPKAAIGILLKHPELGPVLNRWADKGAAAQVREAVERVRGETRVQTEQELQEQAEAEHFQSLSKEELAEELATNEKAAAAYARFKERQQRGAGGASPEEVGLRIKVEAASGIIRTFLGLIEESGLPDEKKAELDPTNFTILGEDALPEWGKAIYTALIELAVQKKYDEEWESEKTSRLADLEEKRPDLSGGKTPGPALNLIETPSEVLLEKALAEKEQQRVKGG